MEGAKHVARRRHAQELKQAVLDECRAGASVASVAMAHGLNANLVHKWRRDDRSQVAGTSMPTNVVPTFNPLAIQAPVLPAPTSAPQPQPCELRIELRRGAIVATVSWPISASAECAGWLRELLR